MPFFPEMHILSLLTTVFWLWMLIDCVLNKRLSSGSKVGWFLFILFIPIRILNGNMKMGEVGQGTQALGIISQVIQSLTQHVHQRLERGEDEVVKVFFAQFIPDVFYRVDFRTIGWLLDQADVLRND